MDVDSDWRNDNIALDFEKKFYLIGKLLWKLDNLSLYFKKKNLLNFSSAEPPDYALIAFVTF